MRTIKFRLWDTIKEIFIPNNIYAVTNPSESHCFAIAIMIDNYDNYLVGEYFYKPIAALTQFTGLYDGTKFEDLTTQEQKDWRLQHNKQDEWKGKEIFEGDIIEFLLPIKKLEYYSSSDIWGTEPQNSFSVCKYATYPIKASAEVFISGSPFVVSIRNIKSKILDIENETDYEDYLLCDPNEEAGGADGFNQKINDFYADIIDFTIDTCYYDDFDFNQLIKIKVIGNIYENSKLIKD